MKTTLETLDVGLADKFKLACRLNLLDESDVNWMCEGDFLAQAKKVRQGYAEVVTLKHIIDMDADPFVPKGLELVSHVRQGQLEFDPQKIKLYLAPGQQGDGRMNGKILQKELDGQSTFNANLLDWFLVKENQKFIPHEWCEKWVFFWKTIYRVSLSYLYARCLYIYDDGSCKSYYRWLDLDFSCSYPAVVAGK